MKSKFFKKLATPLMIALSLTVVSAPTALAAEGSGFSDVGNDNAHYKGIHALTEQGIIKGYNKNEFKPWKNLSRQQAAVILSKAGDFEPASDVAKTLEVYKDIDSNSRYAEEIAMLTEANIFKGDEHNNFNPYANITRQQMASVLVLAMNLEQYNDGEDVKINLENVSASHKERVQILANLGLTNQYDNYRPDESITRAAVATLVHKSEFAGDFSLSLMHMNDTHAHVEPLPQMMTAVKDVREYKPEAMLFHAGDAFSGTLYFTQFGGQADVELFNLMDMTAMAYGNHEFDRGDSEDGNKTLSEFVKAADFPLLGSNIDFSEDPFMSDLVADETMVKNAQGGKSYYSIIEEVDGEEVGVFGLDTEAAANIARPNMVTFNNYLETAKDAIAEFEAAGIDKIIAVTHIGLDNDPTYGNDRLLAQLDGLDVIVGGHSHTAMKQPEVVTEDAKGNEKDPTVIVQAGQYSNYLGTLDVKFDDKGVVVYNEGKLLSTRDYEADPQAAAVLKPYSDEIEAVKTEEIGANAVKEIRNSGTGIGETPIGNLIADAMLAGAQAKVPETVIAFQNGGGIRATIEEGPITVGEVMNVLPFGNDPVTGALTGQEIKETFEHSVHLSPEYHGGYLSVSGMTFKYDSSKESGDRVTEMKVNIDGEFVDIEMDKEYVVTTNEFTAQGGDNFQTLKKVNDEGRFSDIGEIDWEQLRNYLVDELDGVVDPKVEDRIIDIANN